MATVTFSQTGLSPSASGTVLVVDGNSYSYSQLPISFTWEEGTYHTFSWSSPVSGGSGTQFVWSSTSGLSSSQSGTLFITGPGSVTASYTTQYYLTMNAQYGLSVSPNSGWYNAGTQITISATGSSGSEFYSWSGTGSGSYSGTNNPATITMNGPITETANAQYYLTMTAGAGLTVTPSSGWYQSGSQVVITATGSGNTQTQYLFVSWSGSGSGSYSGTNNPATITMNGPISETANSQTQYYVTVNANPSVGGSTSPASGWYNAGTQITFSETPNSGSGYEYVFTGWSGTYSSSSPSFTETVNQPITETANYNEYYYLTMNAQYGLTTSPASGWYLSGSQVTISATGSSGSEFYSWSGTGSGSYTGSNNPATITMNGPISETANAQYYLNVYVNSGSGSVSGSGWYPAGSVATASETPATGYHFVDWTNGATGSTYSFTMNSPNSIGANFGINTYTITFQSSPVEGAPVTVNGNSETTPYSIVVDYGTTVTYSYGSSFSGGSGIQYVNPFPSSGSFTVTSSTTVMADYTTQYYLTMSANSGGSVSPGSGWYNSGTQVSISASPNTGYHFVSWTGSGSGSYSGSNNPVTITMNSPISEIASFEINTYTVTFQSSPVEGAPVTVNGNSETTPYSVVMDYGTTVTYSYGSSFSGGSGIQYVNPFPSSGSFTVTSSTTITADYTTQYYLTMSAQYGLSVSPSSGWYNAGTQITISATGSSGSEFYSWSGTGSGSYSGTNNPSTVTMNGPITETANAQYYLNVYVNSGSGSVSGSGWYPAGSVATASETPATGYHFVDWTNGATGSTYSFTMNGPNSIGANFEINTYTITFQSSPVEGAPVTVNGNSETTPYSIVVDYGTTISYSYDSPFSGGSGVRYVNPSPSSGSFTVTSSTTITASYITQYYFDVYVNSGSGSVSGSGWYNSGSLATAGETPATGYHFVDWTDGVTSSTDTYVMNSPNSVGANFGINSYAVTFQSSPVEGAPVTVDGNSETTPYTIIVNYGTTVSYSYGSPISAGSGMQYANPSPSSGSITVTSSTTITADYTTQYYLTMVANPSSEGSVSPSSGWYNAGSQVTISADAYYSYYFSSWTGSGSGSYTGTSNPATVTMNEPITETANFAQEAEVGYNSQDYGTGAMVSSTAYFSGPSGSFQIYYPGGGTAWAWVPPGTYTISYSTDNYGTSVYSAPSSITVYGGSTTVTATYYTPTSISVHISIDTEDPNLLTISGVLTAADGSGQGLGGQTVTINYIVYQNGNKVGSGTIQTVTSSGGTISAGTYFTQIGNTGGAKVSVTFDNSAGYLGSSNSASYGET
ncbi:MAG: hypothetical protein QXW57_03175 [Candidatus Micrarchaeaceae archaeon]